MSATLSQCRTYRYSLYRNVDLFGAKVFAYFGINPSTADEMLDDHTIKKCMGFTAFNGGSCFYVGNAYAYRSKDVDVLAQIVDPVGPENDAHIDRIMTSADILVPCWGSRSKLPRQLHARLDQLLDKLVRSGKPVLVFGLTVSGDPVHPQMLSYRTPLVPIGQPRQKRP